MAPGFTARGVGEVLVSREESLDRISPDALQPFERIAVLNPAADLPRVRTTTNDAASQTAGGAVPGTDARPRGTGRVGLDPSQVAENGAAELASTPTEAGDPARMFGGLQAKLFVSDTAEGSVVLTGSANATDAAFGGNVEVVAELRGPSGIGVDAFLAETPGEADLVDLLVDYQPREQPVETTATEQLELELDDLRRRLAAVDFCATVQAYGDDFRLTLTSNQPLPLVRGR